MRHGFSMITAVSAAALLASSVGCGGDDSGSSATQTTAVLPDQVSVTYQCPSVPNQPGTGAVRVVDAGVCGYVDGLGHVTYGLLVENTSDQTVYDVIVDVEVHDSTGVSHGRSIPHHIYALQPGQRIGTGYYAVVHGSADIVGLEFDVDVPDAPPTELPAGEITVSDLSTTVEGGERSTTFTLTSTYSRGFEDGLGLFVVYRNEAGEIVGGDDDFITGLGPQGTLTHTITSTYVNPEITQAEVYANPDPRPAQ